jgi:glycosyltransferase involved in cell wall biosynthesis
VFTKHTSLIIPTKDRLDLLNKTILYLFDNKINFKEIIIVDSSKKKIKKKLILLCKKYGIKLLFTKASTSYQRNYGKEVVKKSKYLMFLDDDIIFFKDSFKEMNNAIKKYNFVTGFCFNIVSQKKKTIIIAIFLFFFGLYFQFYFILFLMEFQTLFAMIHSNIYRLLTIFILTKNQQA